MTNVLMITSSCRKNSNSNLLAEQVAAGAREAGHEVTVADIARLNIGPCRGCEHCMRPGADFCVIKDDMLPLYPLVVRADILIFVSPVYWFNISGQLKQFIDRCYAVAVNSDMEGPGMYAGKKIGAVLTYGDEDPFASGCVNALRSFQDICAYTGATWVSAVYGQAHAAGDVAANAELLRKARDYGVKL